jgi:hypothetical protein
LADYSDQVSRAATIRLDRGVPIPGFASGIVRLNSVGMKDIAQKSSYPERRNSCQT